MENREIRVISSLLRTPYVAAGDNKLIIDLPPLVERNVDAQHKGSPAEIRVGDTIVEWGAILTTFRLR